MSKTSQVDPMFSKYINMNPEKDRSGSKPIENRDSEKFPISNLDKLYEKLRKTEAQLKNTTFSNEEQINNGNSAEVVKHENIDSQNNSFQTHSKRLKEEELKKMRDDRLKKLRHDLTSQNSRDSENDPASATVPSKYDSRQNSSPKFKNAENSLRTLDGYMCELPQKDKNYDSGVNKEGTAQFGEYEASEKSIDIARDIVSHSKSAMSRNKSFSQVTNLENEEKYIQVKFYDRFHEKQQAEFNINEKAEENRKKLANSKKMTQASYRIMIKKLEHVLTSIMAEVDRDETKKINFEQLGRILTLAGVFKIIQYDEEFSLANEDQFFSDLNKDQKRRYEEMMIHEQIWHIMAENSEVDTIDAEFAYIVLRILMDPANLSPEEAGELLQEYVEKYKQPPAPDSEFVLDDGIRRLTNFDSIEEPVEKWPLAEIIKKFRKLTENRLAYTRTGYLRPEKDEHMEQVSHYSFKPHISELSLAIEKYHTERFLKDHPINTEDHSLNKSVQQQRENITKLLEEVKEIQKAIQNKELFSPTNASKFIPENNTEVTMDKINEASLWTTKSKEEVVSDRIKILYKKQELINQKREEERRKKDDKEMEECTFQPQVNKLRSSTTRSNEELVSRLYNYHKVQRKREEERLMELIERQTHELEECTFKPEINRDYGYYPNYEPKGFKTTIDRIRKGVEQSKKKKEAIEKKPAGENYEKLRNMKIKPPSFLYEEKKKKVPFVYIDANLGHGKTGRIGIHEDDDPRVLARNFAIAFQLNQDVQQSLENLIAQQLEDFYAKQEEQEANYYE